MGIEYPPAIDMFITDPAWVFTDALTHVPTNDLKIVNHKTANGGPTTAIQLANFFMHDVLGHKSVHFIVGLDGSVVQLVHLKDGAGGNCCVEQGFNTAVWGNLVSTYGNLNRCTISIEHEDWTTDNSQPMPKAQVDASNALNLWLVTKFGLTSAAIQGHMSIDPVSRARCPGPTFNFSQLIAYVNAGVTTVNPHVAQAAFDTWHSTAFLFGTTPLSYTTGIALSWQDLYVRGLHNMPPPTTREFATVDWAGRPIVAQMFGTLRCEWDGKPTWIDTGGHI